MSAPVAEPSAAPLAAGGAPAAKRTPLIQSGPPLQMRFMAIWIGMLALLVLCAIVAPRSLLPSTFLAIIPLAAFLAITAVGEALVLMARGIDLSIPATLTLSSTIILGLSRGREDYALAATAGALLFATGIGVVNGILIAVFRLNAP